MPSAHPRARLERLPGSRHKAPVATPLCSLPHDASEAPARGPCCMNGQHSRMERFGDNARRALSDLGQRRALAAATDLFAQRRQGALQRAPEFEEWRQQAAAIKDATLAHLDQVLVEFEQNATTRGAVVHWAEDGAGACRIVLDLAKRHGASLAVKSKSMTTEEIGLNEELARRGVQATETDLGEWIIQLAHETPFHIVVPAIHKTKAQVGAILHAATGVAADASAAELTAAARKALRAQFARAGMGISGANFAIASTGSILILENEGNARLCTTLPKVHVAIVGIEKMLPDLDSLPVFLRLLPRSGTGQDLTTYQSLLTGPAAGRGEGPSELHIVLLDNGRTRMLAHETTRAALRCIRCGACLNACPVYQQVGGHAYGSVYPGPIGAVVTPQLAGLARAAELPFASSLCGACRDVCPVKIDIPELLLHLRADLRQGQHGKAAAKRRPLERLLFSAWAFGMRSPRRYRLVTGGMRLLHRLLGPALHRLPPLSQWRKGRSALPLAKTSFRAMWRKGLP